MTPMPTQTPTPDHWMNVTTTIRPEMAPLASHPSASASSVQQLATVTNALAALLPGLDHLPLTAAVTRFVPDELRHVVEREVRAILERPVRHDDEQKNGQPHKNENDMVLIHETTLRFNRY
jgi:hypothetical protein